MQQAMLKTVLLNVFVISVELIVAVSYAKLYSLARPL